MNNKQIITKALEKAVENGWDRPKWTLNAYGNRWVTDIIFSHDFAKAFWGKEYHKVSFPPNHTFNLERLEPGEYHCRSWEYHLQQLVLEEDPIKYLERFL